MTEATEKSILSNKFGEVVGTLLLGRRHKKARKLRKSDRNHPPVRQATIKITGVKTKEEALNLLKSIVREG